MTIQSVFLAIAVSVTLISGPASAQSSPQTLIAGVILEAGEIDSSKVKVGFYAEVIYGKDELDQVSGKWEKLDTVEGYWSYPASVESLGLVYQARDRCSFS